MVLPQMFPQTDSRSRIRPPPLLFAGIFIAVLLATLPLLLACGGSREKVNLLVTVGSELEDCEGPPSMKCLVVNGELFYNTIEGFDYEEGYYYRITIERQDLYPGGEPPEGTSRYRYRLVEIMHKERPPEAQGTHSNRAKATGMERLY